MAKLTMLKGLPASGKSKLARELLAKGGNSVRVNKDLIRTMLHFDKWSGRNENLTVKAEDLLIKGMLTLGMNVIIDDTNLTKRHEERFSQMARDFDAKFEIVRVKTDWKTCVEWDAGREKQVGPDVIIQMALATGNIEKPKKGYVLCDLDGTLCDISERLHHVKPQNGESAEQAYTKNWKAFFEGIPNDKLRQDVHDKLQGFHDEGYTIVLVSARPDDYRIETEVWLEKYLQVPYLTLIMRKSGDRRLDTTVKEEILDKYFEGGKYVHRVIDDRPSVIRMWQGRGLEVIDVGGGVEF